MRNDLTDHDKNVVIPELKKLGSESDDNRARQFDLALQMDASRELLSQLAARYVEYDGEIAVRLPYVGKMLKAGYSPEHVRAFIVYMCTVEVHYQEAIHQQALSHDWRAQEVFDVTTLGHMLMLAAEEYPNDTLARCDEVAAMFGRLLKPDWKKGGDNLAKTGMAEAMKVMAHAARNIECLRWDDQLETLLKVEASARVAAAMRVECSAQGLILKGRVLAGMSLSRSDEEYLVGSIYREMIRWTEEKNQPMRVAAIYRWLLKGAQEIRGRRWETASGFMTLRGYMRNLGWTFVLATSRQNPRTNEYEVQVEVSTPAGKVVLKHLRHGGERGDGVSIGQEVMVHKCLWQDVRPVFTGPNLRIFLVEMCPVEPPTYNMEKDSRTFNINR